MVFALQTETEVTVAEPLYGVLFERKCLSMTKKTTWRREADERYLIGSTATATAAGKQKIVHLTITPPTAYVKKTTIVLRTVMMTVVMKMTTTTIAM